MNVMVDQSYRLGHFRDNDDSLRRLKKQAGVVLDLEFEHLRRAGLRDGTAIMDAGCGPGLIAAEIYRRANPSALVAADCNEISLSETRAQFASQNMTLAEVRQFNIYEPSPEKLDFDFIYSRLVFQHLSEPLLALLNLKGALAAGGRLCICDIDDRWFAVSPAIPATEAFLERVRKAQECRGGDRHIGLKLPTTMSLAGFRDIRASALLLSTDLIGKEPFCDLVLGYKLEVVPKSELAAATEEIQKIKDSILTDNGWAAVAVFFVSGAAQEEAP